MKTKAGSRINWWRWLGLLVGAVTIIITRWVYHAPHLFHWDSVQFALALNDFDLSKHQPHPPGYILYVGLGKLLNFIFADANVAFIVLGIIASIIGFYFIYRLARAMFGELAGWLTGIFFIFNSSIWFHGLVAEVYIVEASLVVTILWLGYSYIKQPTTRNLLWLLGVMALLGGIRQAGEVVMLPWLIYIFLQDKHWRQKINWALLAWIGLNLVWAIPLVIMSGGLGEYITVNAQLTHLLSLDFTNPVVMEKIIYRAGYAAILISQTFLPGLVIIGLGGLPFLVRESKLYQKINWQLVWYWLIYLVPGLLFLILVWLTNNGYILFAIPGLIILAAGAVTVITKTLSQFSKIYANIGLAVMCAIVLIFQFFQFYRLSPAAYDYLTASLPSIRLVEDGLSLGDKLLQQKFSPDNTIILASNNFLFFGLRHYQYYHPNFDIYSGTPQAFAETKPIWHVRGEQVHEFINTIPVPANIKYILRAPNLDELGPDSVNHEISLGSLAINVNWGYYDLTNPETVDWLKQQTSMKFDFMGGPNE